MYIYRMCKIVMIYEIVMNMRVSSYNSIAIICGSEISVMFFISLLCQCGGSILVVMECQNLTKFCLDGT